jgi:hypothetical protein
MGCGLCFLASEESKTERKNSGKRFKIFFFPAFAWAGKEKSVVQNGTVLVFFY